ncbi:MAG: acyclic terpene utilization AtuA family protein [Planctomycetota bacterium]|jgi:hypothetical protein
MSKLNEFRILSPTAILGYGYPMDSFQRGLEADPHLIAVDAGSTDPGPYYLGSGKPFTDRVCVKRDLRAMLVEGVGRGIPVVVGTAGGSGAEPHLRWCIDIVQELAAEEGLSFTLGVAHADVPTALVSEALADGRVQPVRGAPALTEAVLNDTENLVAQMGVEPIQKLLQKGCQVILAGRCYDPAVFAALPILKGYAEGLAIHLGKILECAAIAATPGSGSDCVLGTLTEDSFILQALSDKRRFTKESTAAHTLYEKSDPCHLPGPGGSLNLEDCSFEELSDGRVRVSGSRHEEKRPYTVKLEGARAIGFRTVSIAGTRDPIMIASIDEILVEVREQVEEILRKDHIRGEIHFHVYGRNGVMGALEQKSGVTPHELGIVIETIAPTEDESATLCSLTRSSLLHYGYRGRIATAGNLAFPFSPSDLKAGTVYTFSVYHLMELKGESTFRCEVVEIQAAK